MTVMLDRSKRKVEPFRLALNTQRQGSAVSYNPYTQSSLHGLAGLGAMGSLWDDIVQAGGQWLDNKLQQSGISGADIVGIQNQVGATMDSISAQYYTLRDSHQVTVATITQFQNAFRTLINSFCAKAQAIGSTRALNGCTTITYWGERWIADREAEKAQLNSGGTVVGGCTVTDPVTGQCIVFTNPPDSGGIGAVSSYMPILLGAAFIFIMFKSSKKW